MSAKEKISHITVYFTTDTNDDLNKIKDATGIPKSMFCDIAIKKAIEDFHSGGFSIDFNNYRYISQQEANKINKGESK